jgi:alpha-amylase
LPYRPRVTRPVLIASFALVAACSPPGTAGTADAARDAEAPPQLATWVEDWRDEIIYQLVTDRFANGDASNDLEIEPSVPFRYHGGDWQGVLDRLDYIEALGATAIWISPVVRNTGGAYHGYATQAFDEPNPNFGDLGKLRELVDAAHARGLKVIVDVVVNHAGHVFYYDLDGDGTDGPGEINPPYDPTGVRDANGELAVVRWFDDPVRLRHPPRPAAFANLAWYSRRGRIVDWDDPDQRLHGDFNSLKDFDTARADVRAALIAVLQQWIAWTDVDGFRIDTVRHVQHDFLAELAAALRAHAAGLGKRNFLLVGEAFTGDVSELATYTAAGGLDAVLDFQLHFDGVRDVFQLGGPTRGLEDAWHAKEAAYPADPHPGGVAIAPARARVTFLDNHDVPRFLHGQASPEALHAALGYLMLSDGVPCLYYGTEQELAGGPDPANREDLWATGYPTTGETFARIARLAALRRQREALRRGQTQFRWTTTRTDDEQDAGIVAFERFTPDDRVLIVINTHATGTRQTSASSLGFGDMRVGFAEGTELVDLLDASAPALAVAADQRLVVTVPPRGVRVLAAATSSAAPRP